VITGFPDAESDAGPDSTLIDTGIDVGFDSPAETCGASVCSSDLHSVLDCNGNVVQACPADQGCNPTTAACTPACGAAIAGKSYAGCEFYSVAPDVITGYYIEGSCFAVAITNAWTAPMTVAVDRAGATLSGNFVMIPSGKGASMTYAAPSGGMIAPGATALLFLSDSTTGLQKCPAGVTAATTADPAVHGTAYGNAFHIATSMPAVAADYWPYGAAAYTASATLLLPTHAWDVNNVVVDAYVASMAGGGVPSTVIAAMQDSTMVTILPSANIVGSGTVTAATAGTPAMYTLNKGQTLQFTQSADLTGSIVQSNYPTAVWGAHSCMNIDPTTQYCDNAHQQLPGVKQLGHDYVGVRYRNRGTTEETPPWHLVGVVDGTTLTFDPAQTGAPSTLKSGQLATFNAAGPFRVTSQDSLHPFYLEAYMTGGQPFNGGDGDPEFVNVIAAERWRNGYTFFTLPQFPESSVVVVRSSANGGFQDVTLDCAGKLTGWTKVDSTGLYQYTRLNLSTGNFSGQNGCDNGSHTAASSGPFTLTAWGWGTNATNTMSVSYAVPAGMTTH
jgi:hypothetical protein